jgi:hypothetical protein
MTENHRDARVDWPTSTTAVVLWQRGQGIRAAGEPVGVVIGPDYSVTTDRTPIAVERRPEGCCALQTGHACRFSSPVCLGP